VTQAVYIIGGAGTGKSTFTKALLNRTGVALGPLEDLHGKPNSRGTMITLRGHRMTNRPRFPDGLYLGCMRDSFPGTDGLDRVSYIPGEEWLQTALLPAWIVAEGATLAVRRFITVLNETTDLLLVHLHADDFVKELRFGQRGSNQDEKFVLATATRSANLLADMAKVGVKCWDVDSAEPDEWDQALRICEDHIRLSVG
jgi:hypothetical protein